MSETRRDEWLEWRRGGIGASEVAALVGLSPWQSPWSIWANKAGLVPEQDASEAMEFGQRIEPVMAGYFHDRTGLWVAGEQTWCSNPDEPWMRCTVDGFVYEYDAPYLLGEVLGAVEWKSTSDTPKDWETNGVPAHYACQAQWSLAVTGLSAVWFGVLHLAFGRPSFRVYELARDEADIALLTAAARTFWHEHCLTGVPPPTDGSEPTTRALSDAWDAIDDEKVEADYVTAGLVDSLRALKAEAKDIELAVVAHENAIKAKLGEATALTCGTNGKGKPNVLVTWRKNPRTGFDHKALLTRYPRAGAKFITKSETRTFLVKPTKGE